MNKDIGRLKESLVLFSFFLGIVVVGEGASVDVGVFEPSFRQVEPTWLETVMGPFNALHDSVHHGVEVPFVETQTRDSVHGVLDVATWAGVGVGPAQQHVLRRVQTSVLGLQTLHHLSMPTK